MKEPVNLLKVKRGEEMTSEERAKEILKALHQAVVQFDEDKAVKWSRIALDEGVDPFVATMEGLADGMIEDVPLDKFVEEQIRTDSDVVGLSAMMTTSMLAMPVVIRKLREKNPMA